MDIQPLDLDEPAADAEFKLIEALREWNPFGEAQPEILTALSDVAACRSAANTTQEHMCLVRQQSWSALTAECGGNSRMPPEDEYRGALRWRVRKRHLASTNHKGAAAITNQMLQVHSAIKLETVTAQLDGPCCNQHCLKEFVDKPNVIRNWRILWHSMPRSVKHETFTAFIRAQYEEYRRKPINEFCVKYSFLGVGCCKQGFLRATGFGSSFLTACRADAIKGRGSYHLMIDQSFDGEGGPRRSQRRAAYLDARAWVKTYARKHASRSPISGVFELPAGKRKYYHAVYCLDREEQAPGRIEPASLAVFCEAWRLELPQVKVTTRTNNFTQCGLCTFMQLQMDMCPRSNGLLLQSLRRRLGVHFRFQSSQRVKVDEILEIARQSCGKVWAFTIDKMDQTTTVLPSVWSLLSSPIMKLGARLVVGIVGSEWAGPMQTQMLLRSVFQDLSGGSETQCSIVLTNLLHVARREGAYHKKQS